MTIDELPETDDRTPAVSPPVTAPMRHHAHGPWRWLIRSQTFVRKELAEILRQPRLLALLVVGPFVLLLLFGTGFSQDAIRLRTVFVGPEGSVYEEMLDSSGDQLDEFVESQGLVHDKDAALRTLDSGDTDLVVVFPDDPLTSVLAGESATIEVFNREMDPIQQTAIGIAARMAVQEVNATVLSTIATQAQEQVAPAAAITEQLVGVAADINARDPADPATAELLATVQTQLDDLESVIDGSINLLDRLAPDAADTSGLLDARATVDDLRTQAGDPDTLDSEAFLADAESLTESVNQVTTVDPAVLVRPFTVDTSERDRRRHRPDRLLHPGRARVAPAAPCAHVRRVVARARPEHRPVRTPPDRTALVDPDPPRQVHRVPVRRIGGRRRPHVSRGVLARCSVLR